ncbi:hypothetical protein B5V02_00305 [Mesorhizobium kowhaii]|uniref:Uncharacterized protein n=1 Tax=Mesorhizobium kowhaii TaxID=1300272 RepID=A0A2W7CGH8_9HYPH|nr:hypothetical protein B5V02_00305 [Mesorhizobium kowhaii]
MLGSGFALLGGILGALVLLSSGHLLFYQFFSPEIVYWACGRGFGHPAQVLPKLLVFLSDQSTSFSCADLPQDGPLGPVGIFTQTHLYLMSVVAALWRISSIDYNNLWPLISLLAGAYTAGCYALLRLFFARWSAVLGGLILAFSPVALTMLLYPRDFAKAPFLVWGIVLLVAAVRQHRQALTLVHAAAAGAVVGIGYGFRSDVIIMLPLGPFLLLLAIGPGMWLRRALASIVFAACLVLCAWPMLLGNQGGGMGAMLMKGAADPFSRYLGLGAAPYSFGAAYSDEFTLSSIAADLRSTDPGRWDDNEPTPIYGMSQSITSSSGYVAQRFKFVAGDMATRALKSAAWIVGFPAVMDLQRLQQNPGGEADTHSEINRSLRGLYSLVGHPWLPYVGIVGMLAFFWRQSAYRPREAIGLVVVFGVLLGYSGLQFAARHVFQLEFFWVLVILALVHAVLEARRLRPALPRFLTWTVALGVALATTYAGLIGLQTASLRRELVGLRAGSRQIVPVVSVPEAGRTVFPIPIPTQYQPLLAAQPDSMVGQTLPVAVEWNVRAAADRLLLTLGGAQCRKGDFDLALDYAKRDAWQPFDRSIALSTSGEPQQRIEVLVSVYYRATQNISGISLPSAFADCLLSIQKLEKPTQLPMAFSAVLYPGWQDQTLALSLGDFSLPPAVSNNANP